MHALLSFLDTESLSQPKILLIEDCKFDTVFVKNVIDRYYSYAITDHVETKKEACYLLTINTYDVVLLDLNLPDSTSFKDVETIKALAKDTPVIVVTGLSCPEIAKEIKGYGGDGIVGKDILVENDFSTVIQGAVTNIETA